MGHLLTSFCQGDTRGLKIAQASVIALGFTITRWKEPIDGDITHFGCKTKKFIVRLSLAG